MRFTRTKDTLLEAFLQGAVRVTYARLVQTLGEPDDLGVDCLAHWQMEFEDGTKATVYVYRFTGKGEELTEVPMGEHLWRVGGLSQDAVIRVAEVLETEPICWNGPDRRSPPPTTGAGEAIPF